MLDCKAEATALLSEFFSEELNSQRSSLRDFEEFAVQEGTTNLRNAMEHSLEKLDDKFLTSVRMILLSKKKERERWLPPLETCSSSAEFISTNTATGLKF